ncbi:MAG: lysine exporter LysO family protein [Bacteroidales bacterium]|nr:lysine exporter LysO family protein [Bacteroidales bacterium]
MFTIILIMLSGMAAGYLLRRHRPAFLSALITGLIWLLLFLLGLEVGANQELIKALPTLGVEALIITMAALAGCMVGSWLLWRNMVRKSGGDSRKAASDSRPSEEGNPLKGSLIIVSFFVLGCLVAWMGWLPLEVLPADVSFYALCALMCCVGFSIGCDPETIRKFRHLSPKLLLLPLVTILGTWVGCALVSLALSERSVFDCMAVGSGFGYYSLSSIFITEYKGAELGTIALLSNIIREIATLLLAPWMCSVFGRLAPISAGGATTMDTTLPILLRTCGQELAIVAIFHGFVVDFTVPFLVTLLCSL